MKTLKFTEKSKQDIIRLRHFVAKVNPAAAKKIQQSLINSLQQLKNQSQMGVPIKDGVRELISGNYISRYLETEKTILVIRIWHSKEVADRKSPPNSLPFE